MTFEEAAKLLETSNRSELVDKFFGDKEVYFTTPDGESIAEGYDGHSNTNIHVRGTEFTDAEATHLMKLGKLVGRERNDSQADEEFDDEPHGEHYD